MKLKSLTFFVVFASLFQACSSPPRVDNDKFFPLTVGEYSRMFGPQPFGMMSTTKYKKPDAEIYYVFGSFKADVEAQRQFDQKKTCDFPELPDALVGEVVKESVLKDKTGKKIGKLRICRQAIDKIFTVVGDYQYSIRLLNGNTFVSTTALKGSFADLAKFAESLPFNSEVDLKDVQELISTNTSTGMPAQDLMKLDLPVKLAGEPYRKGKFLIVREAPFTKSQTEESQKVAMFVTPSDYDLPKEDFARSYEEAETIFRIACSKGAKLAYYVPKDKDLLQQKFPAYSVNCRLSLIDKTIPAIIAQQDLIGTDILENQTFFPNDKEVRAREPVEKIKAFIKQLPKR